MKKGVITIFSRRKISIIFETILRFPIVISSSIGMSIIIIYLTNRYNVVLEETFDMAILESILVILALGFFIILAVDLYSETQKINSIHLTILAILILWWCYSLLPKGFNNFSDKNFVDLFLLIISIIFVILISPFTAKSFSKNSLEFPKKLLIRFILTITMTGILYVCLGLISQGTGYYINPYFDLRLFDSEEGYFWTGASISLVLAVICFLSGIPKLDALEQQE